MVSRQPIGLSQQLEPPPPICGGEHIVPDGFSRSIRPSATVADLVEAIWDWDIPDSDALYDQGAGPCRKLNLTSSSSRIGRCCGMRDLVRLIVWTIADLFRSWAALSNSP